MKVRIVVVGGIKGALGEVVADYQVRAGRYWKLQVDEVSAGTSAKKAVAADVRAAEEPRILARLPERGRVFLLSREGRGMSSTDLAELLSKAMVGSEPEMCFVIGGAFGVGEGVRKRANRVFSLSDGTLPHEIARLVLTEQLYRAGTILRNEPYHKGGS
jgi:23S rRNA (pseudouridine1915-N3)-methyltransferase